MGPKKLRTRQKPQGGKMNTRKGGRGPNRETLAKEALMRSRKEREQRLQRRNLAKEKLGPWPVLDSWPEKLDSADDISLAAEQPSVETNKRKHHSFQSSTSRSTDLLFQPTVELEYLNVEEADFQTVAGHVNNLSVKTLKQPHGKKVSQSITKNVKQLMNKNKEPMAKLKVKLMKTKIIDEQKNKSEVENVKNLSTDESLKPPKLEEQSITKHVKQLIAKKLEPRIAKVEHSKKPMVEPNAKLMDNKSISEPMDKPGGKNVKNQLPEELFKKPLAITGEPSIAKLMKQLIAKKSEPRIAKIVEVQNSKPDAKPVNNKCIGELMAQPEGKNPETRRKEELFKRPFAIRGELSITKNVKRLIVKNVVEERHVDRPLVRGIVREKKQPTSITEPLKRSAPKEVKQLFSKNVKELIAKNVLKQIVKNVEQPMDKLEVKASVQETIIQLNAELEDIKSSEKPQEQSMPTHVLVEGNLVEESMVQQSVMLEMESERSTTEHVTKSITNVKQLISENVHIAREEYTMSEQLTIETAQESMFQPNDELMKEKLPEEPLKQPIGVEEEEEPVEKTMIQQMVEVMDLQIEDLLEHYRATHAERQPSKEPLNVKNYQVKQLTTEHFNTQLISKNFDQAMDLVSVESSEGPTIKLNAELTDIPSNESMKPPANTFRVKEKHNEGSNEVTNPPTEELLEQPRAEHVKQQPIGDLLNQCSARHVKQSTINDAKKGFFKNLEQPVDKLVVVELAEELRIKLNAELKGKESMKPLAETFRVEEKPDEGSKEVTNPSIEELLEQPRAKHVKHQPTGDLLNQCSAQHMKQSTTKDAKQLVSKNLEQPMDKLETVKPVREPTIQLNAKLTDKPTVITIHVDEKQVERSIGHVLKVTNPLTKELLEHPRAQLVKQQVSKHVNQPMNKLVTNEPAEKPMIQPNAELTYMLQTSQTSKELEKPQAITIHVEEKVVEGSIVNVLKVTKQANERHEQSGTKNVEYQPTEYPLNQKTSSIAEQQISEDVAKMLDEEFMKLCPRGGPDEAPLEQLLPNEHAMEQLATENVRKPATRRRRRKRRKKSKATELSPLDSTESSSAEELLSREDQLGIQPQPSPSTSGLQIFITTLRPQTMHFTREHSEDSVESEDLQIVTVPEELTEEPAKRLEVNYAAMFPESESPLTSEDSEEEIEIPIGWQHVEIKRELIEDSIIDFVKHPIPRPFREKSKQSPLFIVSNYTEQSWIAAVFNDVWYPGLVEKVNADGTVRVNFMGRSRRKKQFVWPRVPHRRVLWPEDVLYTLLHPPVQSRSKYYAVKENTYIDWLSKPYDGSIILF